MFGLLKLRSRMTDNITVFLAGKWANNPYQTILCGRLRRAGFTAYEMPSLFAFLPRILSCQNPVVHFQFLNRLFMGSGIWSSLFLLLAKIKKCRYFVTIHEVPSYRGKKLRKYEKALQNASGIFVFSDFAVSHTLALCPALIPEQFQIIPHGSYESVYGPARARGDARVILNLPKKDFIFMSFGQMFPWKCSENLAELFLSVREIGAKMLLVGACEAVKELQMRKLAGRGSGIIFRPGMIDNDEVTLYFSACDAVIFNYGPCYCSGVLELALTYGKPCVVPDHSYFRERLSDREGHIFFEKKNQESFTRAVKEIRLGRRTAQALDCGWAEAVRIMTGAYRMAVTKKMPARHKIKRRAK